MALIKTRQWIPDGYLDEVEAAGNRALSAGAAEPLSFMGIGATGVVFCGDEGHAWKCGRYPNDRFHAQGIRDEFEFMRDACRIPDISRSIACPYAFHEQEVIIERECPQPRGGEYSWRDWGSAAGDRIFATYERIRKVMGRYGWRGVEFKEDSFVATADRGYVLVDASSPIRVGWPFVRYVREILSGRREVPANTNVSTLAWGLRMDAQDGLIPKEVADEYNAKLRQAFPGSDTY